MKIYLVKRRGLYTAEVACVRSTLRRAIAEAQHGAAVDSDSYNTWTVEEQDLDAPPLVTTTPSYASHWYTPGDAAF